jgi:hypothetical protein
MGEPAINKYSHIFEDNEYKFAICKVVNKEPVGKFFSKNDMKIYYLAHREELGDVVLVNRHGSKLKIVEK